MTSNFGFSTFEFLILTLTSDLVGLLNLQIIRKQTLNLNKKFGKKMLSKKNWKKCWKKNPGTKYCETIILIKIYNEINQLKLSYLSHHIGMYMGNPYTSSLIFISSVTIVPQS